MTFISRNPAPGTARVAASADFTIGEVDPRLFGSFVEHMGRAVYGGIYQPDHESADENGFRRDVLGLVGDLGVTLVRYPGGNFVSGYRWEDGVGPVGHRPRRLDLAWRAVESNEFGLHEFMTWAAAAGVEPMLAVNLGTRGPREAAELVEYANHPRGTALSDLRREHGADKPFDVKLWCLGNEMDGPWQLGAKTADEYGRVAAETAKMMRLVDPRIELVACGSSARSMPTFAQWESTMLEHCYDHVDYVSMHAYYEERDHDLAGFLATGVDMDRYIDDVIATVDHVAARKRSSRRLKIAFDEWNVWYQQAFKGPGAQQWESAPHLIEDTYDVAAAVAVGSYLIALLRHADRVAIACQAQLVNVIAPIRTDATGPAWRQSTYFPFAHAARYARGEVLRLSVESPRYAAEPYGEVPVLDVVATCDYADGAVCVLAVNRHPTDALPLEMSLQGFGALQLREHVAVAADGSPRRTNTATQSDAIAPRPVAGSRVVDGRLLTELPALSWNVIRLGPAG